MTRPRSALTTSLSLAVAALTAILVIHSVPSVSRAADDADDNTRSREATPESIHLPGPAVRESRVTQPWTTPGMSQNPISLTFDPQGNLYVCEAWRAGNAILAIVWEPLRRSNSLQDDLQMQSVADRAAHIERLIAGSFYPREQFTAEADKVRFVQDTDGDGKADRATIFADGFNGEVEGTASGVLYHDNRVYLTNIPNLWLLQDKDGDGDADKTTPGERESLSYGYGLRWGYSGHDLHGLILGPDGRIYFSIGDRGYNITTREGKHLFSKSRGAVFRMWPDGSGLEVFYTGLRNPQELAFDNYGNLFTGDNNCDAGDLARFTYLPEGGDSGWDQDVQSLDHRGPWLREHMWELRKDKNDPSQPAWIIPPLAHVGRGPSGLAHYPGTGDSFAANGSFLMCDFPPGVRHVQLEPDGASFKVTEDSAFVDGQTITDIAWGYDGRLYLADWGGGWIANPRGYIKTMVNPAAHAEQAAVIKEVQSLFAGGFDKLSDKKLIELLGHRDQRVRIAAQWELAKRPLSSDLWMLSFDSNASELSRLHALWAMGMQVRRKPISPADFLPALIDKSEHVRAQAVALLGDTHFPANKNYTSMLNDTSTIVRYHAAIALGKNGTIEDIIPLLDLLERNDNNDATIRHAASYGLSLIGDSEAIHSEAKGRGPAARLGAVLAMRRLNSPLLAEYLDDSDVLTAAEAARAIYDKRITAAMPALAAISDTLTPDRMIEPILRRVIEANVRLGDADSAMRLGRLALNDKAPESFRLLSLSELDQWSAQRNREGVWGAWWPRETQAMEEAISAMTAYLPTMASDPNTQLATRARTLIQKHVAKSSPAELAQMALNAAEPEALRLGTLQLLAEADRALAVDTTKQIASSADGSASLRIAARLLLVGLDEQAGLQSYAQAIKTAQLIEQQDAISRLGAGKANGQIVGEVFVQLTDALKSGKLDASLRLDVVQAVNGNEAMPLPVRVAVQRYTEQNLLPGEEPFIRDAVLAGGDAERGRDLFTNNTAAQCVRCHTVDGKGSVGPDLGAIGRLRDVNYLYNALVNPSRDIADGYASSTITLKDGSIKTGRVVSVKSTPAKIVLANSDGVEEILDRSAIQGLPITGDQSLMPTMKDKLSPGELRDVLAYLVARQAQGDQLAGQGSGSSGRSGPYLKSPAKDLQHFVLLPAILMAIFMGLGVLLLVTVLGGSRAS